MESQNIGSLGAVGLASIIGRLRCRSNSKAGTAFSDLAACVIPRERRGKGEERGKYRNSVRGRGEPVVVRMELSRAANERAQWEGFRAIQFTRNWERVWESSTAFFLPFGRESGRNLLRFAHSLHHAGKRRRSEPRSPNLLVLAQLFIAAQSGLLERIVSPTFIVFDLISYSRHHSWFGFTSIPGYPHCDPMAPCYSTGKLILI